MNLGHLVVSAYQFEQLRKAYHEAKQLRNRLMREMKFRLSARHIIGKKQMDEALPNGVRLVMLTVIYRTHKVIYERTNGRMTMTEEPLNE